MFPSLIALMSMLAPVSAVPICVGRMLAVELMLASGVEYSKVWKMFHNAFSDFWSSNPSTEFIDRTILADELCRGGQRLRGAADSDHIERARCHHAHVLFARLSMHDDLVVAVVAHDRLVLVLRQRNRRHIGPVVHVPRDDRPVGVAFQELHDHLLADMRDGKRTPVRPGRILRHANPARGMLVTFASPVPVEQHPHAAILVGVDVLARRADNRGGLRSLNHRFRGQPLRAERDLGGDRGELVAVVPPVRRSRNNGCRGPSGGPRSGNMAPASPTDRHGPAQG